MIAGLYKRFYWKMLNIFRNSWLDAQFRGRLIPRSLDSVSSDEPSRWNKFVANTTYRWVLFVSYNWTLLSFNLSFFVRSNNFWNTKSNYCRICLINIITDVKFFHIVFSLFFPIILSFAALSLMKNFHSVHFIIEKNW